MILIKLKTAGAGVRAGLCPILKHSAFTLIELLIVLAILGIVMTFAAPKLGERTAKGDAQNAFFKELLAEHLQYAREEGVPIAIIGFKGTANMEKYNGEHVSIPNVKSVQSARINGENTIGLEYHINVYPDGICDYFELETDKKVIFASKPLLLTVVKQAAER
jgi:prepilin-type N-terminal cleavage/methylation domain-containing protein